VNNVNGRAYLSLWTQTFLEAGFLGDVFDAGFSFALAVDTRDLVDLTAADLGADLAAAFLALVAAETPVTVDLAAPFLAVVDFLTGAPFFASAFLPIVPEDFAFLAADAYFLVAGADLAAARLFFGAAVVVAVLAFALAAGRAAGAFLAVEDFAVLVGVVVDFLEGGLAVGLLAGVAFSLAASLRALGASLTFPEGPFGRIKVPFSAPWVMALLSWLAVVALRSMRYLDSTNFLIVGRETPARASSG